MRGLSSVIIWSLVLGCGVGGEAASQFNGTVALSYVEAQVGFGPRIPNSEGHRRAGDWILEQLAERADTVEVQAFSHVTVDGDTLQLRNFLARFEPDSTNRILYLAHWDTRPRADASANLAEQRMPVLGANDGASGVAILLGVADELYREPPAYGVDLLFVDGEDYGDFTGPDVLMGSRHFAANLPEGYMPLFAVLFDMVGDRDLQIPQEGHSVTGAPEVVDRVWRQAQELGYGRVFQSRVGMSVTDDHIPLLEAGIRAIDVIDFSYPYHHTIEDTLDKVSARSLEIVGNVAVALVR